MERIAVVLCACLALAAGREAADRPAAPGVTEFLARNAERYASSLRNAERWLLALPVDPKALQSAGIKGKKKLAEMLDALVRIEQALPAAERAPVRRRIEGIEALTLDPGFHDMNQVDDTVFRQNSTSYLRIAYLLDRLGLDTKGYREQIRKILPRLDRDMKKRGAHQRMAFELYYRHFDLPLPFALTYGARAGSIPARLAPETIGRDEAYSLTHEVFVPFDFGEKLDAKPFSDADLAYLRRTLPLLATRAIETRDPDLLGELTSCLRYLRFTDEPVYVRALEFLLADQRPDGAWGHYEASERTMGELAKAQLYLHTTMVATAALIAAFRR